MRWHSPNTLLNIAPSPLLDTVALATLVNLYNPNTLWDFTSGKFVLHEKKVIKFLSEIAGWNLQQSGGFSVFGEKATLMYAVKIGLSKANKNTIYHGVKDDYIIIASDRAHYSLEDICCYLGKGRNSVIRVKTNHEGKMILDEYNNILFSALKMKKKIVTVILNAGVTIDLCVDPILDVIKTTRAIFDQLQIQTYPHFHADSVVGWSWLFFRYPLYLNQKPINSVVHEKIFAMYDAIKELQEADSFSADFHKTGLCPYTSTFFITKNKSDLLLTKDFNNASESDTFYDVHPHHYTLENSRSGLGIATAWLVLNKLGIKGFQSYLVHMLSIGELFRKNIQADFSSSFFIVNPNTNGFEIVIKLNFFDDQLSWDELLLSSEKTKQIYRKHCYHFKNYLYTIAANQSEYSLIGFVPLYKRTSNEYALPCFLIYPMSIYTSIKTIVHSLTLLEKIKKQYELFAKSHKNENRVKISNIIPPR